jgi:general secretion pathway protein M
MFYLVIWEPVHVSLDTERQKQQTQKEILIWMQQAAAEAESLKASGIKSSIRDKDKPVTLVIEQTIQNAGLKPSVTKIESSGSDGARVTLNEASFNQILVWLNTIATYNGIQVTSANIERASTPGRANARLTLDRP